MGTRVQELRRGRLCLSGFRKVTSSNQLFNTLACILGYRYCKQRQTCLQRGKKWVSKVWPATVTSDSIRYHWKCLRFAFLVSLVSPLVGHHLYGAGRREIMYHQSGDAELGIRASSVNSVAYEMYVLPEALELLSWLFPIWIWTSAFLLM